MGGWGVNEIWKGERGNELQDMGGDKLTEIGMSSEQG